MVDKRNYMLDAVKVLATTAIVFHHYQRQNGILFANHINFNRNSHFEWALMVELFFVIAAFFAYRSGDEKELQRPFGAYIGRKLCRLLPALACSTVFYTGASFVFYRLRGQVFDVQYLPNLWGMIVSSLGLQDGFGLNGYDQNTNMWFVSVLILCYCYHYLIAWISRRRKWNFQWVLVLLLFFFLGLQKLDIRMPFIYGFNIRGFVCYTLGLLVAVLVQKYRVNRPLAALCCAGAVLYVAFTVFAHAYIDTTQAFILLFVPALVILAQTQSAGRIFKHGFWQKLSEISYNVYAWHLNVMLVLELAAPQILHSGKVGDMYLYALLSWLAGTVSHFLLEKPLCRALPVWFHRIFVPKAAA